MGLPQVQVPSTPNYSDFPVYNYSSSVTLKQGEAMSIDTGNVVGGNNEGVGVIKTASSGNDAVGILMEDLPPLSYGRLRCSGLARSIADGSITAGTAVDGSGTTARGVVAHTATKCQVGFALTTASDGDDILVLVAPAHNA